MNILEKIAADKRREVELRRKEMPINILEFLPFFNRTGLSLCNALKESSTGIITEFKRKSPSRPSLNLTAKVEEIIPSYENAGATGLSILTDDPYFGGSLEDFYSARKLVNLPILRKEFIIDEYQILESKAIGADVILLIAALLSKEEILQFSKTAHDLGLEILLEVHNEAELEKSLPSNPEMIGVNNRNLKSFEVDIKTSKELSTKIPKQIVRVSESGISEASTVKELGKYGYRGFLMGENFMKTENPGEAAANFIKSLEV